MKQTVIICKLNADGTETMLPGTHANDKAAIATVKEAGDYILYPVITVTKEDLKKG